MIVAGVWLERIVRKLISKAIVGNGLEEDLRDIVAPFWTELGTQ